MRRQIFRLQVPAQELVHLHQHKTSPEVQPRWIVWRSACDQTPQCSIKFSSPSTFSGHSSVDQQVMDQFAQMQTMLSSYLWQRQETTRTAFCNSLTSTVEALEERDFQTFRTEALKLLSSIQSRPNEKSQTLSRSSSATSTFVIQEPEPALMEYILTIPETQMPASKPIQ